MPCSACPFRLAGPPPVTGAFKADDVDAWLDLKDRWTCHMDGHASLCQGAQMFHDGHLPEVTREALLEFWVVQQGDPHRR